MVYVKAFGKKDHTGVKKSQKTVVFDEVLYLKSSKEIGREDLETGNVRVEVYDADRFSKNDLLGYVPVRACVYVRARVRLTNELTTSSRTFLRIYTNAGTLRSI